MKNSKSIPCKKTSREVLFTDYSTQLSLIKEDNVTEVPQNNELTTENVSVTKLVVFHFFSTPQVKCKDF